MAGISPEEAWRRTNEELRGYFNFTEDDLEANRNGEITSSQTQELRAHLRDKRFEALLNFATCIGAILVMLIFRDSEKDGLFVSDGLFLLVSIIFGILGFSNVDQRQQYMADFAHPHAKSITGHAERKRPIFTNRRRGTPELLIIQDIKFRTSPEQYATIIEGFRYIVYYLPASKFLLSIECDRDNDFSQAYNLRD